MLKEKRNLEAKKRKKPYASNKKSTIEKIYEEIKEVPSMYSA